MDKPSHRYRPDRENVPPQVMGAGEVLWRVCVVVTKTVVGGAALLILFGAAVFFLALGVLYTSRVFYESTKIEQFDVIAFYATELIHDLAMIAMAIVELLLRLLGFFA